MSIRVRSCVVIVVVAVLATLLSTQLSAAPTEYQVKAAFVFNFAKFVEWPGVQADPFTICVFGTDPFDGALDSIVTERGLNGRTVDVRRVAPVSSGRECNIAFLAASESTKMDEFLAHFGRRGVLTVSDATGFAGRGGMIELLLERGRVRLVINIEAAVHANLKISSQLLRLARVIGTEREGGDR